MKHCKVSRETRKSTAPIKNIFNMQYVNDPGLPSVMASDMNSVNGLLTQDNGASVMASDLNGVNGLLTKDNGVSVMASDLNGVNGLLTKDNPHLVFMHCVCHRLNLAVL